MIGLEKEVLMEIRELARAAYHPFEKKTAVISIVDSDAEPVFLKHQPYYLLRPVI